MATKKSSQRDLEETSKVEVPKSAPVEVVKTKDAPPAPLVSNGPAVPFSRWFQAKGYKSHWRGGMEAFTDTSGRKTVEEWNKIFENY